MDWNTGKRYDKRDSITIIVGPYTVTYTPLIEMATVSKPGLLTPEIVHSEDGPGAFERATRWAKEH